MKRLSFGAWGLAIALCLSAAAVRAQTGWVYQGCWNPFPSGTCYDVYRDSAGTYWLCKACGTTTNPSSSTCIRVNPNSPDSGARRARMKEATPGSSPRHQPALGDAAHTFSAGCRDAPIA